MTDSVTNVIVQAGALGLLAVVVIYGVRVVIPRVLDQFTAALQRQRADFQETLERERELFAELVAHEREALERNTAALEQLTARVDELGRRITR